MFLSRTIAEAIATSFPAVNIAVQSRLSQLITFPLLARRHMVTSNSTVVQTAYYFMEVAK
jgi:hypothetical protein